MVVSNQSATVHGQHLEDLPESSVNVDLSNTVVMEVLRQLIARGFDRGNVARIVPDLRVREEHRILEGLVQSHPGAASAHEWNSGELRPVEEPLSPPVFLLPSTLDRKRSATALSCRVPLRRLSSEPTRFNAMPLQSAFVGTSLESVARLFLRVARLDGAGQLMEEERNQLKEAVKHGDLDHVCRVLQHRLDTARIICCICRDEVEVEDIFMVPCSERHRFCKSCIHHLVQAEAFPRCPGHIQCGYELAEDDVRCACGDGLLLEEFSNRILQRALSRIHGYLPCPNPRCNNGVICDVDTCTPIECSACDQGAICSRCRKQYHYHVNCASVQSVAERWIDWLVTGRSDYHGQNASMDQQQQAVQIVLAQYKQLKADEDWMAEHCRICPRCHRIIERMAGGCSTIKCGSDYHGGNRQQGCGHTFDWYTAPRYAPSVQESKTAPSEQVAWSEAAMHTQHFTSCSECHALIRGPRFRCIHCEAYDCCIECEPKLSEVHSSEHIFEVLFAALDPINEDLLVGMEIEVFGLEGPLASLNGSLTKVIRYLPRIKCYDLDIEVAEGKALVPAANVQPSSVTTTEQAQVILESALAQQEARRLYLGLECGQRIQLGRVWASPGMPDISDIVARVVGYSCIRKDLFGVPQYNVQFSAPIEWACQGCLHTNHPEVLQCESCLRQRAAWQGLRAWVRADQVSPLIAQPDDVKILAQCHWAEQERLMGVELANATAKAGLFDLPEGQLVQLQGVSEDGADIIAIVLEYMELPGVLYQYRVRPYDAEWAHHRMPGAVCVKPSKCKPVFWNADHPTEAVERCWVRHKAAVSRITAAVRIADTSRVDGAT